MKAKLISQWGAEKGSEFWIGAEASIGRGEDNDVRLDAKPISSQHARLFFDPDAAAYFLEDLGSLNGTQIDGTAVVRTERLGRLHVLEFGGVCEMLFVTVDAAAEDEAPAASEARPPDEGTKVDAEPPALPGALAAADALPGGTVVEEAPVALPRGLAAEAPSEAATADPAPASGAVEPAPEHEFVLAVIEESGPRRIPLREGENLVGRTKGAEVALATRQLSRRHAVLTVAGERVTVRDLGSRNHTYVEDSRLEADSEVEVKVRSRLRFGLVEAYLLRRDEDERTLPVDVGKNR